MNNSQFRVKFPEKFAVAQIFFNLIPDDKFLDYLEGMLNGVDINYNGIGCEIINNTENPSKDGVLFYAGDDEKFVLNSYVKDFYTDSIKSYCNKYPNDSNKAKRILEIAYERL